MGSAFTVSAFLLLLAYWTGKGCLGDSNEYRLLRDLLVHYDNSVRPVANSTEPLQVIFGMSLYLIIDVDERNQILTTNCWLTQKWNDSHLVWNASDYGGIRVVRIPYQRVWRPDIILYNNADAQYSSSVINTNVIVSDNGEVVWLSHGIFRSSCDINVEFFPFDLQSCKMKWASWTYDGFQIDLRKQTEEGDMTNYQTNGEFDLVDFEAIRHEEFYSCCPEPYPDITYVIKMKRRPLFYVFNLILPCLLINGIALLVFYVPSESGEKVTLGISALLSMTVFLMTIRESLPPTEKTPLISLYYGVSICLVSFASGLSVVTLNLHHRGLRGTEVPYILRRIILGGLARLVMLSFDQMERQTSSSKETSNGANKATNTSPPTPVPSSSGFSSKANSVPSGLTTADLTRCTCPGNKLHRKGRPKAVVSTTTSSGWPSTGLSAEFFERYSLPSNGLQQVGGRVVQERLRLRIQDRYKEAGLDAHRSSTGMMYDMELDDADKYQSPELDFLGLGPPSPLVARFNNSTQRHGTVGRAVIPSPPGPPVLPSVAPPQQPSISSSNSPAVLPANETGASSKVLNNESDVVGANSGNFYEQHLTELMVRVSAAVERNESRLEEQDRREAIALEWKQLALVCDRILLLTFVIITTVATCVVLTSSPHGP